MAACTAVMVAFDVRLSAVGRSDLQQVFNSNALFFIPLFSAAIVGSALVIRRPGHPVGWLFLLLAFTIDASGVIDSYVIYGVFAQPGSLPGAHVAGVISGSTFIPWMALPALILLLTPTGRIDDRFTRVAVWGTVAGAIVAVGAGMFRPYSGDYAATGVIRNPLEVSTGADVLYVLRWAGIIAVHLGVLAGTGTIAARFLAARSGERQQLRLVGLAGIPFALLVFVALAAALLDQRQVLPVLAGCFVAIVPLAVGLAIEQHRLYDVERLVSRAVSWVVLSTTVVGVYIVVVVFVGQSIGRASDSAVPAVVATLAAVSVVGPLRRGIQNVLDRRFNRRRFETLAMLRAFTHEPTPNMTVEQALRDATGDPSLRIAYWIGERDMWVSEEGSPLEPSSGGTVIRRRGETICVLQYDANALDVPTAEAAAAEVLAELESASLRAAIALQLVETRQSRARIVEAQQAERRRIERDLHDGAQQRLLGLAMQLRAVEVSGDDERMRAAVAGAVDELQVAVRELRELANGLRPAVLVDGGLGAALEDLATRSPAPVRLEATRERFAPALEETAWFIACEAVSNAVKHAAPQSVAISAGRVGDCLRLEIEDDGVGGADPAGSGLRGIADRAEAAGGWLAVRAGELRGTLIVAELPCGS